MPFVVSPIKLVSHSCLNVLQRKYKFYCLNQLLLHEGISVTNLVKIDVYLCD